MYAEVGSISMKSSASLLASNLSTMVNRATGNTHYVVISRNNVTITIVEKGGQSVVDYRTINPKLTKEHGGAATEDVLQLVTILEARFVRVADHDILIVLTTRGIFMYEEENLLFYQSLKNYASNVQESTYYARGMAVLPPNYVAIGTSSGTVLFFEFGPKIKDIRLANELNDRCVTGSIVTLASDSSNGNFLCGSDTSGSLLVWEFKSVKNVKLAYSLRIKPKRAFVSCLSLWQNLLLCAYNNGSIGVYDVFNGTKLIEVAAHARSINSLDVHKDRFVSAGEDCFFRVWEISSINGKIRVNNVDSVKVTDSFLCGAVFNKRSDDICVTCYDSSDIAVYNAK